MRGTPAPVFSGFCGSLAGGFQAFTEDTAVMLPIDDVICETRLYSLTSRTRVSAANTPPEGGSKVRDNWTSVSLAVASRTKAKE